jgi:hypothetical protein
MRSSWLVSAEHSAVLSENLSVKVAKRKLKPDLLNMRLTRKSRLIPVVVLRCSQQVETGRLLTHTPGKKGIRDGTAVLEHLWLPGVSLCTQYTVRQISIVIVYLFGQPSPCFISLDLYSFLFVLTQSPLQSAVNSSLYIVTISSEWELSCAVPFPNTAQGNRVVLHLRSSILTTRNRGVADHATYKSGNSLLLTVSFHMFHAREQKRMLQRHLSCFLAAIQHFIVLSNNLYMKQTHSEVYCLGTYSPRKVGSRAVRCHWWVPD